MMGRKKRPVNKEQEEALYLFIEECGEAVQAATKVLRHGLESCHPNELRGANNSDNLHKEVGDLMAAVEILQRTDVLSKNIVRLRKHDKMRLVGRFLRYVKPWRLE